MPLSLDDLKTERASLDKQLGDAQATVAAIHGAKQMVEHLIKKAEAPAEVAPAAEVPPAPEPAPEPEAKP